MKKIEAKTLEEAYEIAAKEFDCSVTDLEYEIVQHPSSGFLGFGAKNAVIVATCKKDPQNTRLHNIDLDVKTDNPAEQKTNPDTSTGNKSAKAAEDRDMKNADNATASSEEEILNGFFEGSVSSSKVQSKTSKDKKSPEISIDEKELSRKIEEDLKLLMGSTCFEIDVVEVDVIDKTAYIFIDGEDAALLIGKEGYRYNALSYLLYNWLHNEYGLFIKLEIAQFLASQQEMIRNYIQPVVDHVYKEGWGKTRPLDGILVQIALEQLREEFPDKYVAIKRTRNQERYILINEFNNRS